MTTESIGPAPAGTDATPARAAWVSRVAETQMRQFLIPGPTLAATRTVLSASSDRQRFFLVGRAYKDYVESNAADLGYGDRLEMTRRLGPVMVGQKHAPGGRTLIGLHTNALLHAAFDDVAPDGPRAFSGPHAALGKVLAELDGVIDLVQDETCQRIAASIGPTWTGTLDELVDTIGALAA